MPFKKEEVSCRLKDGYLIISVAKGTDNDKKDKDDKCLRRERYSGSVQRSFYVGDALTGKDIKAKFEHGVLMLDLPKIEQKQAEQEHLIQITG